MTVGDDCAGRWCIWSICNSGSVCTLSIKSHLEEHNPERVADFMKGAVAAIKRITSDFDNFQVAFDRSIPFLIKYMFPLMLNSPQSAGLERLC